MSDAIPTKAEAMPEVANEPDSSQRDQRLVLRNTAYLGFAEVLVLPLSVALNGVMGHYLGPEDMGHLYLASTVSRLAFLGVDWGHSGSLPAAVVHDRTQAGTLLGSSIAWRVLAACVAYALILTSQHVLGASPQQRWAVGLVFIGSLLASVASACQEVIRGFERTDIAAYTRVGAQFLAVLLVLPTLMLGGRLRLVLTVQAIAGSIVLLALSRSLRGVGVGSVRFAKPALQKLLTQGTPFLLFSLTLALQPSVDAYFLAKYSSAQVLGWFSVAQKLTGFLIVPASALIGALYPTLCRLHATDPTGFARTTRGSLEGISLLVVPAALGCALYPDIGVSVFGREAFKPAEDTLRVFSVFLFLLYFSMPISTAIVAAGKQKLWSGIQLLCVVNSAVFDPMLIRYFESHHGNGGIGLAVSSGLSESLMVGAGIALMPRGVLDWALLRTLLRAGFAGAAMAAVAWALSWVSAVPSIASAGIAGIAYAIALQATGAVSPEQREMLLAFLRRKLMRRSPG